MAKPDSRECYRPRASTAMLFLPPSAPSCGFRELQPTNPGDCEPFFRLRQRLVEVEMTGAGGGSVASDQLPSLEDGVEKGGGKVVVLADFPPLLQ
jgi:hypothetical protein